MRSRKSSTDKPKYTYVGKTQFKGRQKQFQGEVQRTLDHNLAVADERASCVLRLPASQCPNNTWDYPAELNIRPTDDPTVTAIVTPEQAAYIAVARLRLTPPEPMIGPPPSINQWKMAAVGYPMWLWADGNLNPAPVTDTVYDLTVSLDARLVKISYAMGDGHNVTCTDNTRRWTRGVPAAKPSPACGYTYQKPSLPKGDYTITANAVWAVDWSVNGVRGTIPFYQAASTRLPVGELQVLTR